MTNSMGWPAWFTTREVKLSNLWSSRNEHPTPSTTLQTQFRTYIFAESGHNLNKLHFCQIKERGSVIQPCKFRSHNYHLISLKCFFGFFSSHLLFFFQQVVWSRFVGFKYWRNTFKEHDCMKVWKWKCCQTSKQDTYSSCCGSHILVLQVSAAGMGFGESNWIICRHMLYSWYINIYILIYIYMYSIADIRSWYIASLSALWSSFVAPLSASVSHHLGAAGASWCWHCCQIGGLKWLDSNMFLEGQGGVWKLENLRCMNFCKLPMFLVSDVCSLFPAIPHILPVMPV